MELLQAELRSQSSSSLVAASTNAWIDLTRPLWVPAEAPVVSAGLPVMLCCTVALPSEIHRRCGAYLFFTTALVSVTILSAPCKRIAAMNGSCRSFHKAMGASSLHPPVLRLRSERGSQSRGIGLGRALSPPCYSATSYGEERGGTPAFAIHSLGASARPGRTCTSREPPRIEHRKPRAGP